jgi:hypothetical protein
LSKQSVDYILEWERKLKANQTVILDEHKKMFLYYFLVVLDVFPSYNKIKDALDKE